MSETVQAVVDRVLEAYADLAELGESIEDEWSYVNDLADAWQQRLDMVIDRRGDEPVPVATSAAIDAALAEIDRISDPHRAIDWLSSFPQVVLLALGE